MYENELEQPTAGHATGLKTNANQDPGPAAETTMPLSTDDAALLGRLLCRALDFATKPGNSANSPQNKEILSSAETQAARSLLSNLAGFSSGLANDTTDPRQPNLLGPETTPLFDDPPPTG